MGMEITRIYCSVYLHISHILLHMKYLDAAVIQTSYIRTAFVCEKYCKYTDCNPVYEDASHFTSFFLFCHTQHPKSEFHFHSLLYTWEYQLFRDADLYLYENAGHGHSLWVCNISGKTVDVWLGYSFAEKCCSVLLMFYEFNL